ncbi:MAG: HK97 family phage prohead protease, partial [Hafnia sp.]
TPGHSGASDLKAAMLHGTVEGMSVGFSVTKDDYTLASNGGRIFKNISALREISVCTFPANELAGVSAIKSINGIETIRDVENWLRDSVGLSKSQAVGFIAQFKSAVRSESENDENKSEISALIARINSFPQKLGK